MYNRFTQNIALTAIIGALFTWAACNDPGIDNQGGLTQGTSVPTGAIPHGRISLSIFDSGGTLIYSDSNPGTSLVLTAGVTYNFQISSPNAPAGTLFTLQATNVDAVNSTPTSVTLSLGNNTFVPPTQGDFLLTLTPDGSAATTIATATYQASVTCSNPNFSASSLNPQGISVTAGSGSNLYTFSAANVISGANGMAPYTCAWDLDGDGIVDTAFTDCSTAVSNEYVNYVGTRNIGVIVKDSCNVPQTVSASESLAYTVPAMPGNVFIYGQLAAATGTAQGDSRLDGVNYLATNSGGHNIVKPLYSPGANGKGTFTITSTLNYGTLSSVDFGMQLNLTGFSDTINLSAMTGTIDASAAVLSQTSYSTDQAGDANPARALAGTSCQLTNPGATVIFQQGTPCSAGTTGDNNSADVEVWGNYVCTVNDSGGAVTITGSFDGIAHLADNCVGGGGGGGGGITPIGL